MILSSKINSYSREYSMLPTAGVRFLSVAERNFPILCEIILIFRSTWSVLDKFNPTYPWLDLIFLTSNLLRGVPATPQQTVSTFQQQPGLFQQALGAGLTGLGVYRGFGGG